MVNPNYSFTLDLNDLQPQIVLPIRTNGSKKLQISITNNGEPYQISKKCVAIFCATKSDGTTIVNNCTLEMVSSDTKICYETTPQTTASVGLLTCDIRLYEGEELVLTTPRFYILVDSRAVADENLVSKDEFGFLDSIILEEAERVSNEAERQLNEEARKNAMATVIDENSTHEQYASARAAYEYSRNLDLPGIYGNQVIALTGHAKIWKLATGVYRIGSFVEYKTDTMVKCDEGTTIANGLLCVSKGLGGYSWSLVSAALDSSRFFVGKTSLDGKTGSYSEVITKADVDSELDENSENPVQNKAIVKFISAFGESLKAEIMGSLDEIGDLVGGETEETGETVTLIETAEYEFIQAGENLVILPMELTNDPETLLPVEGVPFNFVFGEIEEQIEFTYMDDGSEVNPTYMAGNSSIVNGNMEDTGETYFINLQLNLDEGTCGVVIFTTEPAGTYTVGLSKVV